MPRSRSAKGCALYLSATVSPLITNESGKVVNVPFCFYMRGGATSKVHGSENEGAIQVELMSGFVGAVVAVLLTKVIEIIIYWNRRQAIIPGIVAECNYNLSIIDEILAGTKDRGGSFKRMSVEYFKSIRSSSMEYFLGKDRLVALSRVIVDIELYNKEADYVFDGKEC